MWKFITGVWKRSNPVLRWEEQIHIEFGYYLMFILCTLNPSLRVKHWSLVYFAFPSIGIEQRILCTLLDLISVLCCLPKEWLFTELEANHHGTWRLTIMEPRCKPLWNLKVDYLSEDSLELQDLWGDHHRLYTLTPSWAWPSWVW